MAENGEKPTGVSGSPFDEPDENTVLSSSDDEAALTEEEAETPGKLGPVDFQEQAELAKYMPSISREDSSAHEETNADWEGMNDELADFLGSDAGDDSESDMESTQSGDTTTTTETIPSSAKKRKRGEDVISTDGEESDVSQNGSKLQRRKRKALARTTSLTNVAAILSSPAGKGVVPPDDIPEEEDENPEDDEDGDLEAELEAEMLRQAEEDEEDD